MSVEKVREILKIAQDTTSLETPVGDEEDSMLGDFIADTSQPSPIEAASRELLKENIEEVLLPDTAIVKSFTIVHLPIPNSALKPPSIVANLLIDGADQHLIHLVGGCKNEDVHIGMRVKAVWRDKSEWGYTLDNIAYFEPSGEPDVDIEALQVSRLEQARRYAQAKVETQ